MGKEEKKSYEELRRELDVAIASRDYWQEQYEKANMRYRLFREAVGNLLKLTDY